MADFDAQALVTSLPLSQGSRGEQQGQQLAPELPIERAAPAPVEAQQPFFEGDRRSWHFKMRGVDSSGSYTTWVVLGTPDPDGLQATRFNTIPTMTGTIVAGSGVVLAKWGDVFPDGSG